MKSKNVVCSLPYDMYAKLKYIADMMQLSMPQLLNQILNQEVFIQAVDSMFTAVCSSTERHITLNNIDN